jgi:tripartite-type tricarboxylate transporter receptor subunit TctC
MDRMPADAGFMPLMENDMRYLTLIAICLASAATPALAQDFPAKVIRIFATGAGGGGDIVGRLIGQELTSVWGQQVIMDNRNSVVANQTVQKAPPDGYTLLINSTSLWLWPYLNKNSPWDPIKDFAPVTLTISQPNLLVVHPLLPVKNVKELIALARSRPAQLNYATGNIGSTTHLASELFNSMAGVKIVSVLYKSTATALTDVVGGHVQLMFSNAASVMPQVKVGKLKALAHTYMQPTALAPGLPAVSDSLPGYEAVTILGIFAPAGTPSAILNKLSQETTRALHKPDIKEKLFSIGMDAVGGTPDQLMAAVKGEMTKWGKVIQDSNIRLD